MDRRKVDVKKIVSSDSVRQYGMVIFRRLLLRGSFLFVTIHSGLWEASAMVNVGTLAKGQLNRVEESYIARLSQVPLRRRCTRALVGLGLLW